MGWHTWHQRKASSSLDRHDAQPLYSTAKVAQAERQQKASQQLLLVRRASILNPPAWLACSAWKETCGRMHRMSGQW